ncbi:hypothetical protein QBC36DRAFT_311123 [Triangularia setosa]|uniref:Uncharacterized protein n=1 Tax=Triangularia setosa TaxID=2587417 RepID=A0AAN6W7H9_9PEZI|nr:hypothetical protein QBC36DRAFT_311123 [Podospora setosa]
MRTSGAPSRDTAGATTQAPNIDPKSRPEFGRDEVRKIVERVRKSTPPLDSKSEEYGLERDVNAYLIQYTRKKAPSSTHVQYLEPYEEELTDSRFKGRFPDQRLAMNVVLSADGDSARSAIGNTPPGRSILERDTIDAEDSIRIRYFHLPSNNMQSADMEHSGLR